MKKDLEDRVDKLIEKGIGCVELCRNCIRKCEKELNHQGYHTCENVGHSLRALSGCHYEGKDGIKLPSLNFCN